MPLIIGALRQTRELVKSICRDLDGSYPGLLRHAVVAGIHLPKAIRRLDRRFFGNRLGAYAMCLNHWLPFLPVPVVLINAEWLGEDRSLWHRYDLDVSRNYHPECGCPIKYIVCHEIAHFIYVNLTAAKRNQWEQSFEQLCPTGYSTNAEESFCEAFSGHLAGLTGKSYDDVPRFVTPYSNL